MSLNPQELAEIKDWFERKISSLERDSYRAFTDKIVFPPSIGRGAAPFPIVLFCMSCLDFFSAAYFGYSEKRKFRSRIDQTKRMVEFCYEYLHYPKDVSKIAIETFRHKLVHLGEPHMPSKHRKTGIIGWKISSIEDPKDHWKIIHIDKSGNKAVSFGVLNFIADLKKGVLGSGGYLEDLSKGDSVQKRYFSFYQEIL